MDGLFDFVHDDIGIKILSLLPQKSLLKFRSVSKSWRHTIDDSTFRELHNNTRHNVEDIAFLQLFISNSSGTWKLLMRLVHSQRSCFCEFPYHDFFRYDVYGGFLKLCGPVHGLICIYQDCSIALCNPSLGKIKILPPSKKVIYHRFVNRNRCGLHNVGFGYDNDKKDYKVVQMWFNGIVGRTVVEVYSRRENKWRVLPDQPPLPIHYLIIMEPIRRLWPWISARMVYWYSPGWSELDSVILSFDMHTEAFKMIVIPFIEYSRKLNIVVKDDSILLFAYVTLPTLDVDIWEYKMDWVKVVRLRQLDEVKSWMNDGLVFKISADSKLVVYDFLSKKEIKGIDLVPKLDKDEYVRKIEYMGSFVLP